MLRTSPLLRAAWAFIAANGAFMLWVAYAGDLWSYDELGWYQLFVLRPGMVAVGLGSLVAGTWQAWLGYTRLGARLYARYDDWRFDRDYARWRAEHQAFMPEMLTAVPGCDCDQCCALRGESVLVLYPDGQHRLEDAPPSDRFTQTFEGYGDARKINEALAPRGCDKEA